jgi:hypothetical protein
MSRLTGTLRGRGRVARNSLSAATAGAAIGAILTVALLGAAPAAIATTTYTRSASCAGLDFYPTDSATSYNNDGTVRGRTSSTGSGTFRCDPGAPTGAIVKKVQFTLRWGGPPGSVWQCMYRRSGLTVSSAETANTIAHVPDPGGVVGNPQFRQSTTAISYGTIDNANYGYWLECTIPDYYGSGIYGADVIYTITAAKG